MQLLSDAESNTKTAKSLKSGEWIGKVLHLKPANSGGFETVCPESTPGCRKACLNLAGRGHFKNIQNSRLEKTKLYFENRDKFFLLLFQEVQTLDKAAKRVGKKAFCRLNATSDIAWEQQNYLGGNNIFELFPDIQFYDYTKRPERLWQVRRAGITNYHLTFSRSEHNWNICKEVLADGWNVAVVFKPFVPEIYEHFRVIRGDENDRRFNDPKGVVVGLLAKGPMGWRDNTAFVVNLQIDLFERMKA